MATLLTPDHIIVPDLPPALTAGLDKLSEEQRASALAKIRRCYETILREDRLNHDRTRMTTNETHAEEPIEPDAVTLEQFEKARPHFERLPAEKRAQAEANYMKGLLRTQREDRPAKPQSQAA